MSKKNITQTIVQYFEDPKESKALAAIKRISEQAKNKSSNNLLRIDSKIGIRGISRISKTKKYKCDFSYHGKRFYFKDWKTVEEAVYNRKIVEDYFGIETLSKNPLAQQYIDKLTEEQKQLIKNYVYDRIS